MIDIELFTGKEKQYYYFKYLLEELLKLIDGNGDIKTSKLKALLPWSDNLPDKCHKPRR